MNDADQPGGALRPGVMELLPRPRRRWVWRIVPALVVVALATTIAVWPRVHDAGGRSAIPAASPPRPTADVAAARAKAALRGCPAPDTDNPGPAALRDVRAPCLGDGSAVDLGAALAGRTTLVNVWASWCEVCKEELPVLDAYARSSGAAQVLGVQILSEPADGLGLLASLGVHFPSVLDADGAVTRALHAPAYVPVSFVVTREGDVRQVLPPTPFKTSAEVDQVVRAMASGRN